MLNTSSYIPEGISTIIASVILAISTPHSSTSKGTTIVLIEPSEY